MLKFWRGWFKKDELVEIIHLHAHNRLSFFLYSKLNAAEQMGLKIHREQYQIHDGSWDEVYLVSEKQLNKRGGMDKLREETEKLFFAAYTETPNWY